MTTVSPPLCLLGAGETRGLMREMSDEEKELEEGIRKELNYGR